MSSNSAGPMPPDGTSVTGVVPPRPITLREALRHGTLFLLTVASMALVHAFDPDTGGLSLRAGLLFAVPAIAMLAAHEGGHYIASRIHRVDCSLPYFIPLPFGFGTLGAVIRMRSRFPNRNALFDIGVAGPLAGLVVVLPVLLLGVHFSKPIEAPPASFPPGMSLLRLAGDFGVWLRHTVDGVGSAATDTAPTMMTFGDNILSLAATRLFWGKLPVGTELSAHPFFMAAWFGMFITALNLIPIGQFDGGHVLRAFLSSERAERIGRQAAMTLLVLSLVCSVTWLVWFLLASRVVGFGHPPPLDDETPLSPKRRVIAYATWAITILTFIPIPTDVLN